MMPTLHITGTVEGTAVWGSCRQLQTVRGSWQHSLFRCTNLPNSWPGFWDTIWQTIQHVKWFCHKSHSSHGPLGVFQDIWLCLRLGAVHKPSNSLMRKTPPCRALPVPSVELVSQARIAEEVLPAPLINLNQSSRFL